jgi:site-specific DNA-methyltransferase (adenine-specific)
MLEPIAQRSKTPTPYYQDDLVTLYLGDCREVTEWLSADVLVTDPPYGRAWRQGRLKGHHSDNLNQGIANDETTEVRDAALSLWGIDRPAISFGDLMLPPPNGTKLVCIYRKPADSGLRGAMAGVRRDADAIYLLNKWTSGIGGRSSVFASHRPLVGGSAGIVSRAGGHPHTKAGDVMVDLLRLTEGTVADPFAGSGSTLVAAKQLGRKAIGVEIDERYCEIAARRLSQGVLDFGGVA